MTSFKDAWEITATQKRALQSSSHSAPASQGPGAERPISAPILQR